MSGDADIARVSALIGEPSRARVLMALADGRALPAGVLADEAGVSASTISEHLRMLLDAHLVDVERQGRTRRYRPNRRLGWVVSGHSPASQRIKLTQSDHWCAPHSCNEILPIFWPGKTIASFVPAG